MAKRKTLKNGRNAGKSGAFSAVPAEMQRSPAFRSLPASALRVLLWCLFKHYKAANTDGRPSGRPTFKLTNKEAKDSLTMNAQTFSRAKELLAEKGFIKWTLRGGLKGCNGVASEFMLIDDWKSWDGGAKQ